MWSGVDISSVLTVGTYRLTWKSIAGTLDDVVDLPLPFEVDIQSKKMIINSEKKNPSDGTVTIEIQVLENPLPAMVIVLGVIAVLGVTFGYLSLTKIEKLVDSPTVTIFIGVLAVVAFFAVVKYFKT